mmetsp:Transcript_15080/g.23809  ORF Transcript_15080/g.23809 Transcript_15080/m.23809 type:complete len:201 (+) Transcript_15080:826-1428(+)
MVMRTSIEDDPVQITRPERNTSSFMGRGRPNLILSTAAVTKSGGFPLTSRVSEHQSKAMLPASASKSSSSRPMSTLPVFPTYSSLRDNAVEKRYAIACVLPIPTESASRRRHNSCVTVLFPNFGDICQTSPASPIAWLLKKRMCIAESLVSFSHCLREPLAWLAAVNSGQADELSATLACCATLRPAIGEENEIATQGCH